MGNVMVRCKGCGSRNRVPLEKTEMSPKCGKCGEVLMVEITDTPVDVTDHTMQREVMDHPGLVLLDCWAPWCGPCRTVAPMLESLASEFRGQVKIAKINVDENQLVSQMFGVKSIPTMLFFENGKHVDSMVGAHPREALESRIKSHL